jgi:acetyl esterase
MNNNTIIKRSERLDPRVEAMLQQQEEQGIPALETMTPEKARAFIVTAAKEIAGPPKDVAAVEELNAIGTGGQIPIRVYTPRGEGPFPVLIYYHGGGWVFGNLDTHDNVCRFLSEGAGCVVVSVDYRLAPENKFPAAVEDAYAASQWVKYNVSFINGDLTRIAVGGDSAGATLAAVVASMFRDKPGPQPVLQLLAYPSTNLSSFDTDSYRECGEGYGLTKAALEWFRGHYLEKEEDRLNPHVSPLLAEDLSGLAPALVLTAEFDVLKDEGKAYADRLQQAGVAVTYKEYPGMIHAGVAWAAALDLVSDALNEAVTALHSAFSK